jgi:hypothetical protein
MAAAVYVLCALTSFACGVLLLRAYRRSSSRLLLWGGLCFLGLALDNVLLFTDLVVVPELDLAIWRNLIALVAFSLLLFGLIWEA